jgi:hypothetical protein
MSDVKRYYVRGVHWAEAGEATRECDCSWPCVKVVKAEDFDALASRLDRAVELLKICLDAQTGIWGEINSFVNESAVERQEIKS